MLPDAHHSFAHLVPPVACIAAFATAALYPSRLLTVLSGSQARRDPSRHC